MLRALSGSPEKKSVSALCVSSTISMRTFTESAHHPIANRAGLEECLCYIFEVVKKIGHSFALRVCENIVVVYFRAA